MPEMWYYTNEGKQMDPVSIKELKRLVGDGTLKPTDMVWKEGMARWIRASSVTELFPDPSSALDHYFSNSAAAKSSGGTETTSVRAAAAGSSAPSPVAAGAPQSTDAPKTKKDKSAGEEAPDTRKPPRRRAEAPSTGGGGWGLMIFGLIGAFVLIGCFVVGIVILIVVTRPADGDGKKDGIVQADKGQDGKGNPNDGGNPVVNPNLPRIKGQTTYSTSVPSNGVSSKSFFFERGATYEITVTSQPRHPDVDLYIMQGNNVDLCDDSVGPDSSLRWTPNQDGEYRIELRNLDPQTRVQSNVIIRETAPAPKRDDKKIPQGDPLPPNTFDGNGFKDFLVTSVRKEQIFKFRVKAGHKASFSVTPINAKMPMLKLIVMKDTDEKILAEENEPLPSPRVTFQATATEIVRVRVIHAGGKGVIRGTLTYDVSP